VSAQIIHLRAYLFAKRNPEALMPRGVEPVEWAAQNQPQGQARAWSERVSCSACRKRGHTRRTCTDRAAIRRADEIRDRERAAAHAYLEAIYSGQHPDPAVTRLCGICRHPGHTRTTCPDRKRFPWELAVVSGWNEAASTAGQAGMLGTEEETTDG
jgi:hypothetical protein